MADMHLGFSLRLGFRPRTLEVGTHRILLLAIFIYTFAHVTMMPKLGVKLAFKF
jgi:hypothetical protein